MPRALGDAGRQAVPALGGGIDVGLDPVARLVRARVRARVRVRVRARIRARVRARVRVRVWVRPCLASRQRPCRHQADRRRGWLGRAKPRRWRLQH